MTKREASLLPVSSLAYLGDAVIEVMVRELLVTDGTCRGDIHKRAAEFVTAVSQSAAAEKLLPHLTEDEADVYRRGRNATHTAPKSATHAQYSRATGLECVFGYLHLAGEKERIGDLFSIAYKERENDENL